ncbi:MAG: cobyric acid synthase, partial [Lachnospiraceae bacterium]|nr:cobyric acid synthase [Lachnospiraceae bacterium]
KAYDKLAANYDIIVVEGAGSPVELNLKKDDIVNMGLAKMIEAPVLLVGDIDRGGIFPQLLGTLDLLEKDERSLIKGLIVNKFRGDARLFEDGVKILEERGNAKVVGVVPYMDVKLDDEDSLSERFYVNQTKEIDVAVIRLNHISNFTDFDTFEQLDEVSVRYVKTPEELGNPDIIIIPGSKNTLEDLRAIKDNGLADLVKTKVLRDHTPIFGICGGYQMLGRRIEDPKGVESGGSEEGLSLLPVDTVLGEEKTRTNFKGVISDSTGKFEGLKGKPVEGYEIHMGTTTPYEDLTEFTSERTGFCQGNVYGTYVHGFFDRKEVLEAVTGFEDTMDYGAFRETQYDLLAKVLRESLDMDYIYEIMGIKR